MTTPQALDYLLQQFGRSILDEPVKVCSFLKDLAPESKAANIALLSCLELGLHNRLLRHGSSNIADMVDYVHEERGLDKTLTTKTLQSLAEKLGLLKATIQPVIAQPKPVIATTPKIINPIRITSPNAGDFVFVKGGKFIMGCTPEMGDCDDDEKPEHRVKVNSFYMAKTEVTQAQWEAIMGNNPSNFDDNLQNPVERVSWDEVQEFIKKLNQREGSNAYRLPTEAEWEYAARGGNKPDGTMYAGSNNIYEVAWYDGNSGDKTHPVAQKKPNSLDIYDMSGNVWEMCADIYAPYQAQYMDNPYIQKGGGSRVDRGGSWYYNARNCRVSNRFNDTPSLLYNNIGFRLLWVVTPNHLTTLLPYMAPDFPDLSG